MFRAWCAAEGGEVLLSPRRIRAVRLTDETAEIHFTCWCGAEGHVVDRRLRAPVPHSAPAPHPAPVPTEPVAA